MDSSKSKSAAQSCGEAVKMTTEVFPSNKRNKAVVSDDMLLEVLLRLPIKSILRFRAVCRPWATLISSKDFCSLHMAHSTVVSPPPKLLMISHAARMDSTGMYLCSPSGSRVDLLFTFDCARHNSMEVVTPSPCYGLTLLYDAVAPAYHVCNAATRAVTRLPPCPDPGHISTAGLGFDARTREYKVVRLINVEGSDKDLIRCDVYTPGAGWRPAAGGVPVRLFKFASSAVTNAQMYKVPPVFANGFLHWLINPYHINRRPKAAIISFSVTDETFGRVRSPPFQTSEVRRPRPDPKYEGEHLVEMDNQLCMVRDLRSTSSLECTLEIWKLLDYNPGEWSLNHRIDLFRHVGVQAYLHDSQVVRVIGSINSCRSGKKIVIASSKYLFNDQFEKKLHTYDPSCQALQTIFSITETHTSVVHCRPGSRFGLFQESLVPVHETDA